MLAKVVAPMVHLAPLHRAIKLPDRAIKLPRQAIKLLYWFIKQASIPYHLRFLPASQLGESVATGEQDQPMGEEVVVSEDDYEDDGVEEEVETKQAATSSARSNYHIVRVTRISHTFAKDDFFFKDRKGKSKSTTRDNWRKTTHNGQLAWKHHKYICFDDVF